MKTSSRHKWRLSLVTRGEERWRVVKSEVLLFTSRNPCVYRGFRQIGEEWRVKTRVVFFFETRVAIFSPDISFCAWWWQDIALVKGNIVPLPGNKWNKPLYIPSGLSWLPLSDVLTTHKYPQSIFPHKQKNTKVPLTAQHEPQGGLKVMSNLNSKLTFLLQPQQAFQLSSWL